MSVDAYEGVNAELLGRFLRRAAGPMYAGDHEPVAWLRWALTELEHVAVERLHRAVGEVEELARRLHWLGEVNPLESAVRLWLRDPNWVRRLLHPVPQPRQMVA